jgi:hypothetical protein
METNLHRLDAMLAGSRGGVFSRTILTGKSPFS